MNFLLTLWEYIAFSAPYLLLGLFVSGLLKAFLSVELIKNKLGKKNLKTVCLASAVGVPMPLCSCSVIPAAVTLKKSGASNGATSAFLISTPESGVDSISITYSMMDLPMAIIRPLVAFVSAAFAGIMQNLFNDFEPVLEEEAPKSCCSKKKKAASQNAPLGERFLAGLKYAFTDLIADISFWLFIGLVAGAMINFFLPADFFMGFSGWTGRFVILGIGLPLYICASSSTPIAASMVLKGMSPGSALIFLLVGPATNFSNIAVLQNYLGKRGVIINMVAISFVALLASYLTDLYYADQILNWKISTHHHHGISWWENLCGVTLSLLMMRGIYVDKIRRLL